jgi:hypothetical protein
LFLAPSAAERVKLDLKENCMSIRTKKNEGKETAAAPSARTNSLHRAVLFLLDQAKMNNRDITREADRHARILTENLKSPANPDPDPVKEAPAEQPAPADNAPPTDPSTDTAALLRESRRSERFKKRV